MPLLMPLLLIAGCAAAGTMTAFVLFVFCRLCLARVPLLLEIVGRLVAFVSVGVILTLLVAALDPPLDGPMNAVWAFIAFLLTLLLLLCGLIGLMHGRLFSALWYRAFAILMVEAGVAVVIMLSLTDYWSVIPDLPALSFDIALFAGLLGLELFWPLLGRITPS